MALSDRILGALDVDQETITFSELLDRLEDSTYGLLIIMLAIPGAVPGPPGMATPFGIALLGLSIQFAIGKKSPWFPKWLRDKKLKTDKKKGFTAKAARLLGFLERFSKERWAPMIDNRVFHLIMGILMAICSAAMILPLPMTNSIPALGILIMGIGVMEKDFLFGVVGVITSAIGVFIASVVIFVVFSILRAGFTGSCGDLYKEAESELKQMLGREAPESPEAPNDATTEPSPQ